ncbi:uncharacterized protein FOMMEDRAFT_170062 [Fomitiporia mediterranea MF3/22]|uniref:uncharacterized protein n=1 Tax=Fomitiporia mediterranea (strain MF3/22) TaxID=694068 RepID=UPI0004409B15|nr:uncharacterized protein FOMMEDRAFT_170062 [Fomitiporia mediterranea MF3/22]EJC99972.1 hypothetical protein FOMMEDRAFT_170062 [Fomitiporia mediterranea MF3/22]
MACTPHKSVQWSNNNEVNEFVYGSPYSEASSTDSISAGSTLQYINSQLLAHGFARGTGISFEGLSKDDADKLSKCLIGMLSQRNEDMSRAEDLSTKLRTLTYEHERLATMHRTVSEQLACAERETNLFKSRLAASHKQLHASEAAHKATSAELQRTRSSMQSVRQTHAAELKRREKETEKAMDRWQKICDMQTKLGSSSSGIKFKPTLANPVVSSRDSEVIGRGPDAVEDALDEAQMARKELMEENTSLKNVVLSAANELLRISHAIHLRIGEPTEEEPPHFTLSDMFSISAPENASEKFNTLLSSFQEIVTHLGVTYDPASESTTPQLPPTRSASQGAQKMDGNSQCGDGKELLRLQSTVVDLRRQLEQAQTQKQTGAYADQAQAIIRRFVNSDDEKANVHERQLLEKIRKELDHARKKVDEAALTLKDEKVALEEEKQDFYREQRLWRSQMCIPQDDGAPKPITGLGAYFDKPAEPLELPVSLPRQSQKIKKIKSPKKGMTPSRKQTGAPRSPAKPAFAVGKIGKKLRPINSPKKPSGSMLGVSTLRPKVIPPMETEVMPTAPALPSTSSAQSLIAPNSFVLPPPSPLASLPSHKPELLSTKPIPAPSFGHSTTPPEDQSFSDDLEADEQQHPTPKKPFPVAKPLAQHMIHAYSPARPSPLSRILLLANSPVQSVTAPEEDVDSPFQAEGAEGLDYGAGAVTSGSGTSAAMMVEDELDVDDLTCAADESPLRAKNMRLARKNKSASHPTSGVRDKGKLKSSTLRGSAKPVGRQTDKENGAINPMSSRAQRPVPIVKQSTTAKPLINGKGGARRVPIGSVDAAPIGPGWK